MLGQEGCYGDNSLNCFLLKKNYLANWLTLAKSSVNTGYGEKGKRNEHAWNSYCISVLRTALFDKSFLSIFLSCTDEIKTQSKTTHIFGVIKSISTKSLADTSHGTDWGRFFLLSCSPTVPCAAPIPRLLTLTFCQIFTPCVFEGRALSNLLLNPQF